MPQLYSLFQQRVKYDNEIKELKQVILKGKDVILQDELKGMKRVLRRLGADWIISIYRVGYRIFAHS